MERSGLPRLPDDFLDIAFYLYPSRQDAENGKDLGGTGFIVFKPFERLKENAAFCLVTNKHVIQKGNTYIRINRIDGGKPDIFHIDEAEWHPHKGPHDVTVALGIGDAQIHPLSRTVWYWQLMSRTMAKDEYDIGIGDDVFMIGRFIGNDGKIQNRPSLRFGNISVDASNIYNTEAEYNEESYAVEMKSKPGYSGSAVFVYALRNSTVRKSKHKEFCMCLGVNWGHIMEKRPVLDEAGKVVKPRRYVPAPTDMSGVVPSWHIRSLLDSSPVMDGIRKIEERTMATMAASRVVTQQAVSPDDANPNHLEDFNRLVDVAARKRPRGDQT